MKLPNVEKASIPQKKVTHYLLSPSHPDGRGKAGFFARFGFTPDSWQTLAAALLRHAAAHDVTKIEASPYGIRYIIEGSLETPDGRAPLVRVVWFIDTDEEIPRLVTAYPQ